MSDPLTAIARVSLGFFPTPIQHLKRLSAALGGPQIFVKRDDQSGLATGGNKTRKLEFLMAQALNAGADVVITAGSTQSNHARQTAAAARACGLEVDLVLYAPEGRDPGARQGNLLLSELLGARIHWTGERAPYRETLARVEMELREAGRRPALIPYGGSNATGMLGYVDAMREVAVQEQALGRFDAHLFATSSGGTQAGMWLGAALYGVSGGLIGISVDLPSSGVEAQVAQIAAAGAALLDADWDALQGQVQQEVSDDYLGGGYAVMGQAERDAIRLLAHTEGILVDPVYTGRAFAGMIDMVRKGRFGAEERVLFWHTGGGAAVFAYGEMLLGR